MKPHGSCRRQGIRLIMRSPAGKCWKLASTLFSCLKMLQGYREQVCHTLKLTTALQHGELDMATWRHKRSEVHAPHSGDSDPAPVAISVSQMRIDAGVIICCPELF